MTSIQESSDYKRRLSFRVNLTEAQRTMLELEIERAWVTARLTVRTPRESISLDALVDRFLAWPLPKDVCADQCATMPGYEHPRSGTNLLTAAQARQMFEHVLGANDI